MEADNPIQMVKDLNFGSVIQRDNSVFIDIPKYLKISPNGQYIALGNQENLYLFNLKHPELSWQNGIEMVDADGVIPTDSGGYWIAKDESIQFINKQGEQTCKMKRSRDRSLWGNDHWLLMHHEKHLKYVDTSNFCIRSIKFQHTILHAWEHGDCLRLLSISMCQMKLFLHEWKRDKSSPKEITGLRYRHDIQFSEHDYSDLRHVHAWPLDDEGVFIKLIPWAITVSCKGRISVSTDHVAWHPVMQQEAPEMQLSKARLAELTACALDRGMEAQTDFDPHNKLYLITTLLSDDSIHFITTMWHKRLSLKHIDMLTDKHLDVSLKDQDVVTLLLANSKRSLVGLQQHLPKSLMHMLFDACTEYRFTLLMNQRQSQINRLFEVTFPESLKQIIDENYNHQAELLHDIYEILEEISLRPRIIPAFFASFDDQFVLSDDDQHVIESSIKILIPIVPDYVKKIIPVSLRSHAPSFRQSLTRVDSQAALFLLARAPDQVFDFDILIFALNHFNSHEDILFEIFTSRSEIWSQYESLPAETKLKLNKAIEKVFKHSPELKEIFLPMLVACQIMVPDNIEYPHAQLIYLLLKPELSIQEVAEHIASQVATGEAFSSDIIEPELEIVQSRRLIPSVILTMLELANARCCDDLIYFNKDELAVLMSGRANNKDRLAGMPALIAIIWEQRADLNESSQWAFASILLAAIKRCLSSDEITSLISGQPNASQYSRMTAEAQLLNATHSKEPRPVQEMLACLHSEIAMGEAHKKISTTMLEHWEDD